MEACRPGTSWSWRRDGGTLLLLLLFFVVWFSDLWLGGNTFYARDMFRSFYPQKIYLAQALAQGRLPHWCPELFCGLPFLADISAGVLYPLNVLLLAPLSDQASVDLFFAAHFYVAAAAMFLLLRGWGRSRPAGVVGGLAFALSGYSVSTAWCGFYLISYAWLPLVLLTATRALARPDARRICVAAVVAGMQFLGGEPQSCWFSVLLLAPYPLVLLRHRREQGRSLRLGRTLGTAVLTAALCVLLAAPQLLPSVELAAHSNRRETLTLAEAQQSYTLHPARLLELPLHRPFGDLAWSDRVWWGNFSEPLSEKTIAWSVTLFCGLSVLAAAAAAILRAGRGARRRRVVWIAGLGLLGVLAALGPRLPVFGWLYTILPWFRHPAKYMGLVAFCLALLAGLGVERLLEGLPAGRVSRRLLLGVVIALHLACAAVVAGAGPLGAALQPERAALATETLQSSVLYAWAILALLTLLAVLQHRGLLGRRGLELAFLALVVVELGLAHFGLGMEAERELYQGEPHLIALLERAGETPRDGHHRLFYRPSKVPVPGSPQAEKPAAVANAFDYHNLYPDGGVNWGIAYPDGYLSSYLARQRMVWRGLLERGRPFELMQLYAVRYLVLPASQAPPDPSRFTHLAVPPQLGIQVAAFHDTNARISLARTAVTATDAQALERIAHRGPAPEAPLLLAADEPPPEPPEATAMTEPLGSCRFLDDRPEHVELVCELRAAGWVALRDTHYPGWEVEVDGTPERIRRADLLFRAVPVPAGRHRIVYRYHPTLFHHGLLLALLGLALGAAAIVYTRVRRRPAGATPPDAA